MEATEEMEPPFGDFLSEVAGVEAPPTDGPILLGVLGAEVEVRVSVELL